MKSSNGQSRFIRNLLKQEVLRQVQELCYPNSIET